jgi:hypothetical protein
MRPKNGDNPYIANAGAKGKGMGTKCIKKGMK